MKKIILIVLAGIIFLKINVLQAQNDHLDANINITRRVEVLLLKMTLDEKIAQLHCYIHYEDEKQIPNEGLGHLSYTFVKEHPEIGTEMYNKMQKHAIENTRLGIPILMHCEALCGTVAYGMTTFPQAIAQASTWNPDLQYRMAEVVAAETKSRGYKQILSPVLNVGYDPRWGRFYETYGEDPYLISRMGVAFVKGFEENGIICTPKHFAANVGAGGRWSYPMHVSELHLREKFFPGFEAVVREANPRCIMTSYNSINGIPCTADKWLLEDILRDEWGFDGYILPDYGALDKLIRVHKVAATKKEAAVMGINAGVDIECPNVDLFDKPLKEAIKEGLVTEERIDEAVRRILKLKFELGLFEKPYFEPEIAKETCHKKEHQHVALKMSQQSIIMLKNQGQTLPLSKNIETITVLGPLGNEIRNGDYSAYGTKRITIYEGIKQLMPNANVILERGADIGSVAIPSVPVANLKTTDGTPGLKAEIFDNMTLSGKPKVVRVDNNVDFNWADGPADPNVPDEKFSVRWTGIFTAPKTGTFNVGLTIDDGGRLYINNELVIDAWENGAVRLVQKPYSFKKGKEYSIKIEYYDNIYNAVCRFGCDAFTTDITAAVEAAKKSDVAVIAVGALDGEGDDRAMLDLTSEQEQLIKEVSQTGTPVVVVLATGTVITMNNWIDDVDAILHAWYPGEKGGQAVAEILFGDVNPSGKLPITYPKTIGQVPWNYNDKVGYTSHYIGIGNEPQFPFGFGLSYNEYQYSSLDLSKKQISENDAIKIKFKVTNKGKYQGDEIVQLYIHDKVASMVRPAKELKRFKRISLQPNETKTVSFTLFADDFKFFNKELEKILEPGDVEVLIGKSSADIVLKEVVTIR